MAEAVTAQRRPDHLIWLDLEMTGLEPKTCTILEIATIVTDAQLRVLEEGPNLAIHHPPRVLNAMELWSRKQHAASGLTERCRASRVSMAAAEAQTLRWLKRWTLPRTSPLCGNSIGHDRRFLVKYMPALHAWCHYRSVDVSTIKELARRWYPSGWELPPKATQHLALEDIRASIAELQHYRQRLFVAPADHPS